MPVRSLNSPVLKWPESTKVEAAFREWAVRLADTMPDILRIGYFGSCARNDWGVGSDLDILVIVKKSDEPFHVRSMHYDTSDLPVPSDILVYTEEEWNGLDPNSKFFKTISKEIVWVE